MMGGGNMQQLARQAQKLQQQMTKKQEELEAELARKTANKPAAQDKPKINKQKTRKEIEALEAQIQESEMRSEELSALLADGATYQDEEKSKLLVSEYKALEESIPLLYEKWEELQMLLE